MNDLAALPMGGASHRPPEGKELPKVWAVYIGKGKVPFWVKACLRFEAEFFRDGFERECFGEVVNYSERLRGMTHLPGVE